MIWTTVFVGTRETCISFMDRTADYYEAADLERWHGHTYFVVALIPRPKLGRD